MNPGDPPTVERLFDAFDDTARSDDLQTDAAVASILGRLGVDGGHSLPPTSPPSSSRPGRGSLMVAAALLLGVALGVAAVLLLGTDRRGPATAALPGSPVAPGVAASGGPPIERVAPPPLDSPAPVPAPAPLAPQPLEPIDVQESPVAPPVESRIALTPAPLESAPTPAPEAVEGPPGPGLLAHGGARMQVHRRTAVLSEGLLTFVRNDDVQPGVDRVRFTSVPVEAVPVGTVFTSGASPGIAAVSVQEGRVFVVTREAPLAEVRVGESIVVLDDPSQPLGLFVLDLEGLGLDDLAARIPEGSSADAAALRRLVANLRLAPVQGGALESVLQFGEEPIE